ncbi:MAG: discoidin domain-containing protein [Planctomycetota bacterium]
MNSKKLWMVYVIVAGCVLSCRSQQARPAKDTESDIIDIAGVWQFRLDPNAVGQSEKWYERQLAGKIKLPGSTAENGFGGDVSMDTQWTGQIVDKSWFTDEKYEKYRQGGSVKVPFWLTPLKHYVGPAWYQKTVTVPESWRGRRITLFLERCHWESDVWVDGKRVGTRNSLSTPHEYDIGILPPGRHSICVCVDNTVRIGVGVNAHSVSDHTQTNWNGIVGKIQLQAADNVHISDVQVYPDVAGKKARVVVSLRKFSGGEVSGTLTVSAKVSNAAKDSRVNRLSKPFGVATESIDVALDYPMGRDVKLWDEFSPNMYRLSVSISGDGFKDSKAVDFGMRQISTEGTHFTVNGRRTFLRGTLECCIFPLTGYPAMETGYWLKIFRAAGAHGLNHLRFHSWCPPEAAFKAADEMGFMLHVECAAWSNSGSAIGDGRPIDEFIYAESDRILRAYGNHPSFCMLAYGNEPAGKNQNQYLGKLVESWKKKDPRRLYTSAAGWPIIEENQYHSTPAPRIHAWGAGLGSRINASPPETYADYRDFVQKYDVPVVSHEIGQWCAYPNFKEIAKYSGVTRAYNFEIFRDTLKGNHMLDQAEDFLMASGKLQTLCYKEEIESALRTPGMGGFQLLDLHDFPGQGTALVGVLDPFWDSKGYVTPEEYHRFCSETVPLARMKKRIWTNDEVFSAKIEVSHFGPAPIEQALPLWSITDAEGNQIAAGELKRRDIELGNAVELGEISVPLAAVKKAGRFVLTVSLGGTAYSNNWDFWVYPGHVDTSVPKGIRLTNSLDDETLGFLRSGGKVVLLPEPGRIKGDASGRVPPGFSSIFWNTAWTRRQAPHTLGILCDPSHPALAAFPTEYHSNWQWWDLVTKSGIMILDDFPPELRPIVQVIDDWFTNRRLGLVFEGRVSGGKLLVCSIDLKSDLEKRPAARQMLHSLLSYVDSSAFRPQNSLDVKVLRDLFAKPSAMQSKDAKVINVDSQAPDCEGYKAIDGDPATIWHTAWQPAPADYPHEIVVKLASATTIKGISYLPRQDMNNGWISGYEFYASSDGENWGVPAAKGAFEKGTELKKIRLSVPVKGRFIRLVALNGFDGKPFAAVAELDVD